MDNFVNAIYAIIFTVLHLKMVEWSQRSLKSHQQWWQLRVMIRLPIGFCGNDICILHSLRAITTYLA